MAEEVAVVVRSQVREGAWARVRRAVRQTHSDYRTLRHRRTSAAAAVAIVAADTREHATADVLRTAVSPHVLSDDTKALAAATAALIAHWPEQRSATACDVLLMTDAAAATFEDGAAQMRVVTVADTAKLQRLLHEAAHDADCRMRLVPDAAAASHTSDVGCGCTSVSSAREILRRMQVEAEACGLAPRHANYLALESVLRGHTNEPQLRPLVSVLHRAAAAGPTAAAAVNGVLEVLDAAGQSSRALAVMSVLVYGGSVPASGLLEWAASVGKDGPLGSPSEAITGPERYRDGLTPLLSMVGDAQSIGSGDAAGGVGDGEGLLPAWADAAIEEKDVSVHEVADDARPPAPLRLVQSEWETSSATLALNAVLGDAREAVVVLDSVIDDALRRQLLALLCGDAPPGGSAPPRALWDRRTRDAAGLPPSWGLRQSLLRRLERSPPRAVLEVHARLCKLYPEYTIVHMPTLDDGDSHACTSFVASAPPGNPIELPCPATPKRKVPSPQ